MRSRHCTQLPLCALIKVVSSATSTFPEPPKADAMSLEDFHTEPSDSMPGFQK